MGESLRGIDTSTLRVINLGIGAVKRLVENVYGWRRYNFGPPTAEYDHTVMVSTDVQWNSLAFSLRWDREEDSVSAYGQLGPLGVRILVGRAEVLEDMPEESTWRWQKELDGREIYVYHRRRHLGAAVDWSRLGGGLSLRGEFGPLGLLTMPK